MAAPAVGWVAGAALQLQQAALWPGPVHLALVASGGLLVLLGGWGLGRPATRARGVALVAALALGAAALAAGSTGWRAESRLSQRLAPGLEGEPLEVTGRVTGLPQVDETGLRFMFLVESATRAGAPVALPGVLWLGWGGSWQDDPLLAGPPPAVRGGERWRLPVRLHRPHGVLNPQGFDAELWSFEQEIGAIGAVREQPGQAPAQRLAPARPWVPSEALSAWRQHLRDQVRLAVPDAAVGGVLAALAVGDQASIDGEGWWLFQRSGVAHLVSISGLHITLFAWLAAQAVGLLWRQWPAAALLWPAPRVAAWGGCLLATAYAALAGWGVPAQRTVALLALTVALRGSGRRWPGWLLGLWAAAGVSAWDPWALLQPGFWLSVVAVQLLMVSAPGPRVRARDAGGARLRAALREGWRAQWVAGIGLAPLAMLCFQQFSVAGVAANLLAVPVITWGVTPLVLAGLVWTPLLQAAAALTAPLLAVLAWCVQWPWAVWPAPVVPEAVAALALAASMLLIMPWPPWWRALALPALLPLLWPALPRPAPGRMELLAADVGQGSAVLVRTQRHLLVFDTGPQVARDSDAGRRILLPLLQALGERRIDRLVLSHADLDHVGGARSLLRGVAVAELRSALPPGHPLRRGGLPHRPCTAGEAWDWDGVHFELLHPVQLEPWPAQARSNALSCVLAVTDGQGRRALLTGDIEAPQEAELVERLGPRLRAQVLVVPHHGSRTSSSAAFLAAVQPQVAVIQVGHRSRYGHPHPSVLARYQASGIPVVRTDQCGAWRWDDGGAWCTREVRRRYWQAEGVESDRDGAGALVAKHPAGEPE